MKPNKIILFFCYVIAAFAVGCASTAPKANFSMPMRAADYVAKGDAVQVEVSHTESVEILRSEIARLAERIELEVARLQDLNTERQEPRSYHVTVNLQRYDKGSAFARAMLAGLGQIRIEALITVKDLDTAELIAEFELKKTFAWGGVYGASTSMEDIEKTFATGVAETLTGQGE